MKNESRKWWVVAIVLALVLLWWTRFQVVQTATGFYRINRITGNVQYGVVLKDARVYLFEQGKVSYTQQPVAPQLTPKK